MSTLSKEIDYVVSDKPYCMGEIGRIIIESLDQKSWRKSMKIDEQSFITIMCDRKKSLLKNRKTEFIDFFYCSVGWICVDMRVWNNLLWSFGVASYVNYSRSAIWRFILRGLFFSGNSMILNLTINYDSAKYLLFDIINFPFHSVNRLGLCDGLFIIFGLLMLGSKYSCAYGDDASRS